MTTDFETIKRSEPTEKKLNKTAKMIRGRGRRMTMPAKKKSVDEENSRLKRREKVEAEQLRWKNVIDVIGIIYVYSTVQYEPVAVSLPVCEMNECGNARPEEI